MKTQQIIPILLLCCLGLRLQAQNDKIVLVDSLLPSSAMLRGAFSVEKKLGRRFSLTIEEELRFKDYVYGTEYNTSNEPIGGLNNRGVSLDRSYTSLSLDYKINSYLKLGAGYTFILINHDGKKSTDYEKYWDLRHRFSVDATAQYKIRQWRFTFRERAILNLRTDSVNPLEKNKTEWLLRSRLGVEYSVRGLPLKPYVTLEISNTLNAISLSGILPNGYRVEIEGNYIEKIRPAVGLKYKINARSSLDFFYRLDINSDQDIDYDYRRSNGTLKEINVTLEKSYVHAIGVSYNFEWL